MSAEGLFEVSVKALLRRPDNALLLLERRGWRGDTFWDLPGGRMKHGEQLGQVLAREIQEETGLAAVVGDRPLASWLWQERDFPPKLTLVYLALTASDADPVLSDEHVSWRWISNVGEVPRLATQARLETNLCGFLLREFAVSRRRRPRKPEQAR